MIRRQTEERRRQRSSLPHEVAPALIAIVSLISAAAYLVFSEGVRHEMAGMSYRVFLLGELVRHTSTAAVSAPRPSVESSSLVATLLFVATCVVTGVLVARRADEGDDAAGPAGVIVVALTMAVAPTLLLSTILWPDGRGHLTSIAMIAATGIVGIAVGGWTARLREKHALAESPVPFVPTFDPDLRPLPQRWTWIAVAIAALPLPLLIWNASTDIRGYDSLAYHLPLAAAWLRHQGIVRGSTIELTQFFPGNHELLVRWALNIGTDAWAFSVSMGAAVLSVVAIYWICREMDQPVPAAAAAAACAATCPLLIALSMSVYSDVTTACALLYAVLFLLRWTRGGCHRLDLIGLTGAAVGFAAGTKLSALPPAAAIAIAGAIAWALEQRRRAAIARADASVPPPVRSLAKPWLAIATFGVAALLTGGYWYLRNAVQHHNPFFPISVLGLRGVAMNYFIYTKPQLASMSWRWLLYPWREFGYDWEYDDAVGLAFAGLAVPALVVVPMLRRGDRRWRMQVWIITAVSYALWLRTGNATARYGLFPILLTYASIGEIWTRVGSTAFRLVTIGCIALSTALTTFDQIALVAYTRQIGRSRVAVPTAIDSLPAARILNAAGAQRTYYAMGRDYQHRVVTPFGDATPADVRREHAQYLLVEDKRLPLFSDALTLAPVAHAGQGDAATSLMKVVADTVAPIPRDTVTPRAPKRSRFAPRKAFRRRAIP